MVFDYKQIAIGKEFAMAETKRPVTTGQVKRKKKVKKTGTVRGFFTLLFTIFLVIMMIGLLTAASVALTVFVDLGLVESKDSKSVSEEVAGVDYLDLDMYLNNQEKTSIIYKYNADGDLVEDTRLHGTENRLIASLSEIPKYTQMAVIALEDERFYDHRGVDWIGTIRSVVMDITGGDLQGGSTITQQLIKNLTGDNKRTVIRKYREIKSALALERHFTKSQILEAYLNTIYLDQGCYGIKTGAEYYFGKDVSELTLMESAILVSITNAPRKFDPIINPENNHNRALHCLAKMVELGMITEEERQAAKEEEIQFVGKLTKKDKEEEEIEAEASETVDEYQSWYTDYIIDTVIDDLTAAYPLTKDQAWRMVYFGGLQIYSAVDDDIQHKMEDIYYNRKGLPAEDPDDDNPLQSASVVMDYEGRILGIAGALDPKIGNRVLSYATDDPRNPGSSIKPLSCYAPAIDGKFYYWSSYLPNWGIEVPWASQSTGVWPSNYGGNYGDPADMRNLADAIAPSLNTIPARIVETMGVNYSFSYLRDRFHLSSLLPTDEGYPALAIGEFTDGVTPLDMCAAYVVFGNGGNYYKPYCYYEVRDADDNVILKPDHTPLRAIEEGTAEVMLHLLQCPVYWPSGTVYPFKVDGYTTYGKSGTSSKNYDKWVCGGTPYYVCATWTGFKYNQEITQYYGRNPGGTLFKEVMDSIHDGLPEKEFERSSEAVARTYCTYSGDLASEYCGSTATGWYRVDALPGECISCRYGGGDHGDDEPVEGEGGDGGNAEAPGGDAGAEVTADE